MQTQHGLVVPTKPNWRNPIQTKTHALCLTLNQFKTSPSEPLFLSLNVYQINIFESVQLMHKIKNKDTRKS